GENVRAVAKAKGVRPEEISVVILERDRHAEMIAECRAAGARVLLIRDGDVAPAIAAARPRSGIDIVYGIGGTPEGVVAASALKCLGGALQGKLYPRNDEERRSLIDDGFDLDAVLMTEDLCSGDDVFFAATGITDGALVRGVKYTDDGARTFSIVMRSRSGTVRRIEGQHNFEKLERFTGKQYRR
ncbi:MAG: fructose-bisphosphatase class II, partial [Actinomycetota bacterium]